MLTEDETKVMEGNDKEYSIIIESEEDSISSNSETEIIPNNLKGKFLNKAIASYKSKYRQYIEQRKAE